MTSVEEPEPLDPGSVDGLRVGIVGDEVKSGDHEISLSRGVSLRVTQGWVSELAEIGASDGLRADDKFKYRDHDISLSNGVASRLIDDSGLADGLRDEEKYKYRDHEISLSNGVSSGVFEL